MRRLLAPAVLFLCACGGHVAVDGGALDQGMPDLATADLGAPDLGAADLGAMDLGAPDLGPADAGPPDLGPPDLGPPCVLDTDCDDHVYCTGYEMCVPTDPTAPRGCEVGVPPCGPGTICIEGTHSCMVSCTGGGDADGDSHPSVLCGGDDCDDADPNAYPGNTEVCDAANHDEDCSSGTFGTRDEDVDGHVSNTCCNTDAAGRLDCGDDCNDASSTVHGGAVETCNAIDDNCDGIIDEGCP